jgi:hypothetical protein
MSRYNARWGVWGPRALDLASFTSTLQAALPAGWRIVPEEGTFAPERVTLAPRPVAPGETAPPDPGVVDLEVQGGRYAGWFKPFQQTEAALLGASPHITGFVVALDVPGPLDETARRDAQRAMNTALAAYDRQGFFSHTLGLLLRPAGEPVAGYAAIDRPSASSPSSSAGLGLLMFGAVLLGVALYSQDTMPRARRA